MKKLVIFAGPPCTGKSSTGRELGWAHLEMDDARLRLLPRAAHTREDRATAYRAVLWTAAHLLRYTEIVICNGGFGHRPERTACAELARESAAALYLVEFTAPLPLILERNRARRPFHPGLDLDDRRVTEIFEGFPWTGLGLSIDSSTPQTGCTAAVRNYVETGNPVPLQALIDAGGLP